VGEGEEKKKKGKEGGRALYGKRGEEDSSAARSSSDVSFIRDRAIGSGKERERKEEEKKKRDRNTAKRVPLSISACVHVSIPKKGEEKKEGEEEKGNSTHDMREEANRTASAASAPARFSSRPRR